MKTMKKATFCSCFIRTYIVYAIIPSGVCFFYTFLYFRFPPLETLWSMLIRCIFFVRSNSILSALKNKKKRIILAPRRLVLLKRCFFYRPILKRMKTNKQQQKMAKLKFWGRVYSFVGTYRCHFFFFCPLYIFLLLVNITHGYKDSWNDLLDWSS